MKSFQPYDVITNTALAFPKVDFIVNINIYL